jgi:hypothetical protein
MPGFVGEFAPPSIVDLVYEQTMLLRKVESAPPGYVLLVEVTIAGMERQIKQIEIRESRIKKVS